MKQPEVKATDCKIPFYRKGPKKADPQRKKVGKRLPPAKGRMGSEC